MLNSNKLNVNTENNNEYINLNNKNEYINLICNVNFYSFVDIN